MPGFSNSNTKYALADGAAADTNIAVAGIKTTDTLLFVKHYSTKAAIATLADITSSCSITSDGYIQCTADTSSDQLEIVWHDSGDV